MISQGLLQLVSSLSLDWTKSHRTRSHANLPRSRTKPTDATAKGPAQPADEGQLNLVVGSEWSQWSSCVDKNGGCDPTRLHSRLRKCVSQQTGEKLDAALCKQRFSHHDKELEVADCSRSCGQQQRQGPQPQPESVGLPVVLSDAPSLGVAGSLPSVMLAGNEPAVWPLAQPAITAAKQLAKEPPAELARYLGPSSLSPLLVASSTERATPATSAAPALAEPAGCSNCTSDEVCLLLMQQKVPFCAKIKDRGDERGCGGWCTGKSQLCQAAGQNAFKCVHDSECLPDEWRCHDSACIPLSKRCDGHSNCYDNSDERGCPAL